MRHSFQQPKNLWLCIFSVLWVLVGLLFAARFVLAGKFLGGGIMGLYAVTAAGLWFRFRWAAWVLITFAVVGIIYSLTKIGHAPWFRIAAPISWAVWAIVLLWEFLEGEGEPGGS